MSKCSSNMLNLLVTPNQTDSPRGFMSQNLHLQEDYSPLQERLTMNKNPCNENQQRE